ncbi:MAG: FxsA family protein [Candidatus Nanohaloarchaea archaeon]|nr:FxsA family protein [Candidatus Nanohaloarchaea archaeon]
MLGLALLLFIGLPLLDLVILVKLAGIIGLLETVLLVVFTGIVGVSLIRQEGVKVLMRLQRAAMMEEVGQAVVEGALLTAGGIFLLSPGIITDLLGFALVFSWTRTRLAAWLRQRLQASGNVHVQVEAF